ncbi:hypothetical protein C8R43DRAFT_947229 [Mycena crocata]|nr:hypothetical protein C8R43DRAFT_947229 [Mycena crocata]
MGATRKGGKKRKNTDAYAGGEASGKKAHPDARTSKKARTTVTATPGSSSSLPDEVFPVEEGLPDDLSTPDTTPLLSPMVPPAPLAEDSPEMLLRKSLALYNAMFPIDTPQTTSYYRDNTYLPIVTGSYYR